MKRYGGFFLAIFLLICSACGAKVEMRRWADFEPEESLPHFSANSGANAKVVDLPGAPSGSQALEVNLVREGVCAVLFDVGDMDMSGVTGVRFAIKGNGDDTLLFDMTVNVTDPRGVDRFIDPVIRDVEGEAVDLSLPGWQEKTYSFRRHFNLNRNMAKNANRIGFFFFSKGPSSSPLYLDNIRLVRDPEDVSDLGNHFKVAKAEGPRLWFSEEDLPRIRERVKTGMLREIWLKAQGWAAEQMELPRPYRGYMVGEGEAASAQGRQMHSQVLGLAFVGLVDENEAYIRRACEMTREAADHLGPSEINTMQQALSVGDMAMPMMLAYDWLNAHMSDEERLIVKNEVYEYGAWTMAARLKLPFGEQIKERFAHNWNPVITAPLGLAGLLLDEPEWIEVAKVHVDGYLKHSTDDTGAARESGGYLALGSSAAYTFVEAYEHLTGVDMTAPHEEQLRKIGRFYAEMMRPWGGQGVFLNQGAATADKAGWFIYLASKFQDPLWMWDYYRWYGDPEKWGGNGTLGVESHPMHEANSPALVLHFDETLTPKSPGELGFPLTHQFQKGIVVARDGWEDDSAYLWFKSDASWGGWSHADDNSFGFYAYGDPIVADPGHYFFYTDSHNALLIDGQGQAYKGPGHGVNGKITRFEDLGSHVIATGDATEAYSTFITDDPHLPVDHVLRTVCLVRGKNPFLLVLDDASMQDGAEHDWAIHYHYGMRNNPATIELDLAARTIHSVGPRKQTQARTVLLWPKEATLEFLTIPKSTLVSGAYKTRSVNPHFITVIAPVPAGEDANTFSVKTEGDWASMEVELTFPDGEVRQVKLIGGDVQLP